jgi:oligoendopeptidase F
MGIANLPESSESFVDATWDDILPYYETLANHLLDHSTVDEWLREWSTLEELISEAASLASVGYTTDTANEEMERAHLRFSSEIRPRMQEQSVRLSKRLVDLGYERDDLKTTIRQFRNRLGLLREENLPLEERIARLNA